MHLNQSLTGNTKVVPSETRGGMPTRTKPLCGGRQHAVALGWQLDQIGVIDSVYSDLGQSGASTADREGFQRLITEVSLGRAGIVVGLEVSRLARNSMDWTSSDGWGSARLAIP